MTLFWSDNWFCDGMKIEPLVSEPWMNSKAFVTEKYAVIERREPVKEKNLKWKRGMPKIRKMFEKEGETEEKAEKEKYMCRKLEGNNLRS